MPARHPPASPPPPDHKPARDAPEPKASAIGEIIPAAHAAALSEKDVGALNALLADLAESKKALAAAKAKQQEAADAVSAIDAKASRLRHEVVAVVIRASGGDLDDNVVFLDDAVAAQVREAVAGAKAKDAGDLLRRLTLPSMPR